MTLMAYLVLLLGLLSFNLASATSVSNKHGSLSDTSDSDTLARIEVLINMLRDDMKVLMVDQIQLKQKVEDLSDETQDSYNDLKQALDLVKADQKKLKDDMGQVKSNQTLVRKDMAQVKADQASVKRILNDHADETEISFTAVISKTEILTSKTNRLKKLLDLVKANQTQVMKDVTEVKSDQKLLKKDLNKHSDNAESSLTVLDYKTDTLTSKTDDLKHILSNILDKCGPSTSPIPSTTTAASKSEAPSTTSTPLPTSTPSGPLRDCQAWYDNGHIESGVYRISPDGASVFTAYCEQRQYGGGWTVIQRRMDGSVDFDQGWQTYKSGFGKKDGEYWLGTENMYLLTKNKDKKLKIELGNKDSGETNYANYASFWLKSAAEHYQLNINGFSSSSLKYDVMAYNNQRPFSTKDADRDTCDTINCAETFGGGWWYWCCSHSKLNALYGGLMGWHDGSSRTQHLSAVRMLLK